MRFTASASPGDAAGKPASMTSTRSRASCFATLTFSSTVSAAPGRLLPVAQRGVEDPDDARHQATPSPGVASAFAPVAVGPAVGRLLRIDEGHVAAQLATDLLDPAPARSRRAAA